MNFIWQWIKNISHVKSILIPLQHVQISHRNAAEHGSDDVEEALVGAG